MANSCQLVTGSAPNPRLILLAQSQSFTERSNIPQQVEASVRVGSMGFLCPRLLQKLCPHWGPTMHSGTVCRLLGLSADGHLSLLTCPS